MIALFCIARLLTNTHDYRPNTCYYWIIMDYVTRQFEAIIWSDCLILLVLGTGNVCLVIPEPVFTTSSADTP